MALPHDHAGRPVDTEDIAVTGTAKSSLLFRPRASLISLGCAAAADCRYRISRDIFKSGDFESKRIWALVAGVGDVEGAVLSPYARWTELAIYDGTLGKFALNKTSPLKGVRDIKLTGHVTELVTNGGFESAEVGGVPPGWTENLVGGSTITEDAVEYDTGAKSQVFANAAGGAGTTLFQQFAVTAEKLHGIIVALYGDGVSGMRCKVVDDASGEYLTSAGAWQAGAAYVLTQAAAAWARAEIPFVAKAAATTVTITAECIANNGAGNVDSVGCSLIENELIQQSFIPVITSKTMELVINHKESAVPSGLAVALQPAADPTKYMQSDGTTWNTTEYWAPIVGALTSTKFTRAFTPDFSGPLLMRIRAMSLGGLTAQIDDVYTWELALDTDVLHTGGDIHVLMDQAGRVSAKSVAGTATLSIATLIP